MVWALIALNCPYATSAPGLGLATLTGRVLLDAYRGKPSWWVGRGGGRDGDLFQADVESGNWETQQYEVSTKADGPPTRNYFSLEEFVAAVGVRKD